MPDKFDFLCKGQTQIFHAELISNGKYHVNFYGIGILYDSWVVEGFVKHKIWNII